MVVSKNSEAEFILGKQLRNFSRDIATFKVEEHLPMRVRLVERN